MSTNLGQNQPVAPTQPYAQPTTPAQPYATGTPQPYQQAPQQPYATAPQPPYGQQPASPYQQPYGYAGQGGQPPQPPYPGQPMYGAVPQQPKKKVWPWVLGGCLVLFVLMIAGFVGCVSCTALMADRYESSYDSGSNSYNYDYGYNSSDSGSSSDSTNTYSGLTLSDIQKAAGDVPSTVTDGRCTPGVFEVGAGKDIEPGQYFLEGAEDIESNFYVFDYDTSNSSYALEDNVVYFGNYFADFEEGDVVVYLPNKDSLRMYPTSKADFKPAAPYTGGLYRVGTDIPAGTYTISVNNTSYNVSTAESAAYIMKDLDFDADSITESKYVVAGGTQTITVKDGDWLELYAATAIAAE